MLIGVLAGLAAGALWGLTFVAPLAVAPFSVVDLTIARYGVFGITSVALMFADARFRVPLRALTPKLALTGLLLGVLGYVGYFIAAAYAAKLAGPAIPPLVIGLLPVLLAVIGNWSDGSLPWEKLGIPLAFIMMGTLAVDLKTLADSPDALSTDSASGSARCAPSWRSASGCSMRC